MVSSRRLILLLCAALSPLAAASPAGAIVGGSAVPITDHPWQVALLDASVAGNKNAQFCGGVIRDATHVITAAHCVFDNPKTAPGQPIDPSRLAVLSGTSVLDGAPATARAAVAAVSVQPGYTAADLPVDDSALVTLAQTLPVDASHQPLPLVDDAQWASLPQSAFVTGWGSTKPDGTVYPNALQGVGVSVFSDATCDAEYPGKYKDPLMVCAGDPGGGKDSCKGDSGGPLVSDFQGIGRRLIGIVSAGGFPCADARAQGVYTEVAAPAVRGFVTQSAPTPAPRSQVGPSISGTPQAGSPLACDPGSWSAAPSLAVQFVRTAGGADTALTNFGDAATYTATDQDVGATISCIVQATNAGGTSSARSAAVGPVAASPSAPAPAPSPAPIPAPKDTTAPVAHIRSARCVKRTCTLTVTVTDAGFSAGVAKVTGSVRSTYRAPCVRRGRRTTCTRHRTRLFTARRTSATRFTIKVTKLPLGAQLFTVLATDRAGQQQLLPTRKTLRVRRR